MVALSKEILLMLLTSVLCLKSFSWCQTNTENAHNTNGNLRR